MVDKNIVKQLGTSNEDIEKQVNELFRPEHGELLNEMLDKKIDALVPGTIITGKIVTKLGNDVIVELGLKSEGIVDASEFDDHDEIVPGKEIEVLLEEVDAEGGILLSKRKADRIRGWERIIENNKARMLFYSIFLNIFFLAPHTGQVSGASSSTVIPQT